ncbi:hypothetical protein K432DRAFT_325251 [Lepidopterella palustris CBS 459.81]|uniref:Integral membrane protein n=1 Tax=Lepidopterella palustris CBS 459.81 TaxID=1314670 RepID=A0A8E2EDV1_9PEZI|nr:hypothetical protein K432DRAFT_325251 [Lepidopterella palustris CBS 459.81]
MGKAGRFACIFVPMALTIASLLCLIMVFAAQISKSNNVEQSLYFFKANTKNFTANPNILPNDNIDNKLLSALQSSASSKELKDFYTVGLWNYCEGDTDAKGVSKTTYCSPRQASFWFNPIDVWGLSNTTAQKVFPNKLQDGLNAYHSVSKWMFAAYTIAFWLTVGEIVVGIFAIFSRWGSFVTTIVSTASSVMILAAAATSTALYSTLAATFDSVLEPYKIKASVGTKMLAVEWLAVAFSLGAGFFWLISTCCCSGKSGKSKKVIVEKTPYTYERVASPYLGAREGGHEGVPHQSMPQAGTAHNSAYEPFRQV